MRSVFVRVGRGLGVALGAVLATAALGQQITVSPIARGKAPATDPNAPGSVHPVEIYQGPNRRVDYVTQGNLSPSDRMAVEELQRAENDLAYVNSLQRLKQQYVNDERTLQPQRRYVQELLYGSSITTTRAPEAVSGGWGGWGGYGGFGAYGAYAGGYGYPYTWGGYGGLGGYGGGWGGSGWSSGVSTTTTRNLQFGMGDEGRIKDALAPVIALQATPEYSSQALRNYENAVTRAGGSPALARVLPFKKGEGRFAADFPAKFKKGDNLVLTLRGGDKVVGTLVDENADWVVVQTKGGQVTVRKAEINLAEKTATPAGGTDK
jgi:hypothetical protein